MSSCHGTIKNDIAYTYEITDCNDTIRINIGRLFVKDICAHSKNIVGYANSIGNIDYSIPIGIT